MVVKKKTVTKSSIKSTKPKEDQQKPFKADPKDFVQIALAIYEGYLKEYSTIEKLQIASVMHAISIQMMSTECTLSVLESSANA